MTRAMRFLAICMLLAAAPAWAAEPPPHYVSQRVDKAYLREGPTYQHRVLWIYRQKGYPFQVIASFDFWRRVRTPDGTIGWMSSIMLSDRRTVLVTGKGRAPLLDSAGGAKIVGLADAGALLGLRACALDYCRVYSGDIDGWIAKSRIWGADRGEVFK